MSIIAMLPIESKARGSARNSLAVSFFFSASFKSILYKRGADLKRYLNVRTLSYINRRRKKRGNMAEDLAPKLAGFLLILIGASPFINLPIPAPGTLPYQIVIILLGLICLFASGKKKEQDISKLLQKLSK